MAARFPTDPSFSSVSFKINTPQLKTTSFSGITRRVAQGHQFYTFTVKYPPLTSREAAYVQSFLAARLGAYDAFEIVLPEISYSKAQHTDSGLVISTTQSVSTGSTQVQISVNDASHHNKQIIKGGDLIKFGNHSKVYIATADVNTSASGTGTIYFSGGLVTSVTATTTCTQNAVPLTVILDGDVQEYDMGLGGITSLTLDMREVW